MNVLAISTNFPDPAHLTWASWNKSSINAISLEQNVTAIVPRPIAPPLTSYYRIPRIEVNQNYSIHYVRFPYLLPKKYMYGLTGDLFRAFVGRYVEKSVKNSIIDKPDVIHSFHPYPDSYGVIDLSKKFGVPYVVTVHSRRNIQYCTNKVVRALQNASKIFPVSESLIPFIASLGIPYDRIFHISLGVNPDDFKPIDIADSKIIGPKYGIGNEQIVLFVGQLLPIKNVETIIKSIPYVIKRLEYTNKKVRFVIVGDGPERKKLECLARRLNVMNYLIFTGKIPFGDPELFEWYGISDIFVLPSFSEGKPVAIYEAMSSGCAIISSNVDGIPEQVKNGENGYLINPFLPMDFSEKLARLLLDDNVLNCMKKESRRLLFELGYTWDQYAAKVQKAYNGL